MLYPYTCTYVYVYKYMYISLFSLCYYIGGGVIVIFHIRENVYKAICAWTYINPIIDMFYMYREFALLCLSNCVEGLCFVSLKEKNI